MESRRCALQQRARSSFEKAHAGEAPPRLQVIGFNVCAPPKAAETEARRLELASGASRTEAPDLVFSQPAPPTKPASSPRSVLQQLLLTQSLHSTSPPSSTHLLPRAASPSLPPHPPATTFPSTNQKVTSGLPPVNSPPSTHQSDSSSGILKSLVQSGKADADDPGNQSFISFTDHCQSLSQSKGVNSPSPRNYRSAGGVSVNVHVTNGYSPEPSRASSIKEIKYAAFHDEPGYRGKKICVERPDPEAKGKQSSWFHRDDEEPSSTEKCTDRSWKGLPQISHCSLRNEKNRKSSWIDESTSKKSSLFMFVVSSPVTEVQHHLHHGEYNSEDTDFLSSCHLCRRHLGHGKDVFMYSGDKAFCSMECRYQQIVIDERKERCPPPIIRSGASQVYQHTYIGATSPTTTTHHPVAIGKPHFINTAAAA